MNNKYLLLVILLLIPFFGVSNIIIVNKSTDGNSPGYLRYAIKTEAVDLDTILIDVKGDLELDSTITFPALNNLVIIGPYPKHFLIQPAAGFIGSSLFKIQNTQNLIIGKIGFRAPGGGQRAIEASNNINLSIVDCLFENLGSSSDDGGVIFALETDLNIQNCSFITNTADKGGAIYLSGGVSAFVNCTFIGNLSTGHGGAIYETNSAELNLIHGTFHENQATGGAALGEMIAVLNSDLHLQNNASAGNGTLNQIEDLGASNFFTYGGNILKTSGSETFPFPPDAGDFFDNSIAAGLRLFILEDGYGLKYYPIRDASSAFRNSGVIGGILGVLEFDGRRAPRIIEGTPDAGACEYTDLIVLNDSPIITTNSFSWCVANALASVNYIEFDIDLPGFSVIEPVSLAGITTRTYIDAFTEPGSAIPGPSPDGTAGVTPGIHEIEINGGSGAAALTLSPGASGSAVSGLSMTNFTVSALNVTANGSNIFGNTIGYASDGSLAASLNEGILLSGNSITIGGSEHYKRNVITGNGGASPNAQIYVISGSSARIGGNFIGIQPDGLSVPGGIAATYNGIVVTPGVSDLEIGFRQTHLGRNVISGVDIGIQLLGGAGIEISNNLIGLDYQGTSDLGNKTGIHVDGDVTNLDIGLNALRGKNYINGNNNEQIRISAGDNINITNNYVGLNFDGGVLALATDIGVLVDDISANTVKIGGNDATYPNVISGNSTGISITAIGSDGEIRNNLIGTDATGTSDIGTQNMGIEVLNITTNLNIGAPGVGNVISGHNTGSATGILILNSVVVNISANIIGLDITGTSTISNGLGIEIKASNNISVGGLKSLNQGNTISANSGFGLSINGGSDIVFVRGNFIGLRGDGAAGSGFGNGSGGIRVGDVGTVSIGGSANEGNVIAGSNSAVAAGIILDNINTLTTISGNMVGLNATGVGTAETKNFHGIIIKDDHQANIGGAVGNENYISGNTNTGILVESPNVSIDGNYIGIDAVGAFDAAPNITGIEATSFVLIGSSGARTNIIGHNSGDGIFLNGSGASNSTINSSYIGTETSGTVDLGNGGNGISIIGADNIKLGDLYDNVISANDEDGIYLDGSQNVIIIKGVSGSNTLASLGNAKNGIYISNGSHNTRIGTSLTATTGFKVGSNVDAGILIQDSDNTKIYGAYVGIAPTNVAYGNHDGIIVINSDSTIIGEGWTLNRRCVIANSPDGNGILLDNANAGKVQGCSIGINITENGPGTNEIGIAIINGSTNNLIGGVGDYNLRNTISGNTIAGIKLESVGNNITYNNIGTYGTAVQGFGNQMYGVWVTSLGSTTIIGGNIITERNLIAGNDSAGVFLDNCNDVIVRGNLIGAVPTTPKHVYGVLIAGPLAGGNNIGSTPYSVLGNVIISSSFAGIHIRDGAHDNLVQANRIGVDDTGVIPVIGQGTGVRISPDAGILNIIGVNVTNGGNLISGNGTGILIDGANQTLVYNNNIGINDVSSAALPNFDGIILTDGSTSNVIGGESAVHKNTISGNTNIGITISGSSSNNNQVLGNNIGTGILGITAYANETGVLIDNGANNNFIGNTLSGEGNNISGNNQAGIYIVNSDNNFIYRNNIGLSVGNNFGVVVDNSDGTIIGGGYDKRNLFVRNDTSEITLVDAVNTVIEGNIIGINPITSTVLGGVFGIYIEGGAGNIVGNDGPGLRNVISGHQIAGIFVDNAPSADLLIRNNFIGTDTLGAAGLAGSGNGSGILIQNSSGVTIGGPRATHKNIISGNIQHGVVMAGASDNFVLGNNIGINFDEDTYYGNGLIGVLMAGGSDNNKIGSESVTDSYNAISANLIGVSSVDSDLNLIARNYISNNVSGTIAAMGGANSQVNGVILDTGSTNCRVFENIIGGGTANSGVLIRHSTTTLNQVHGNYIGVDVTSDNILPNFSGVTIEDGAFDNTIGGPNIEDRNVISGNTNAQIDLNLTANNTITNCVIGTNDDGSIIHSGNYGILGINISNTTIGGVGSFERNFITDMAFEGIELVDCDGVNIVGNDIGIRVDATPGANSSNGINLNGTINSIVGGSTIVEGNTIQGNLGAGIAVFNNAEFNVISHNSMANNGEQGIDLENDGLTSAEDGVIVAGGNNQEIDFPELTSAFACDGTSNTLVGVITHVPAGTVCIIEMFSNGVATETHGEGESFITSATFSPTTNPDTLSIDLGSPLPTGTILSATITQNNNTSEFAENITVTAPPVSATFTVNDESCLGADDAYIAINAPDAYYFFESGGMSEVYGMDQDTLFLAPGSYTANAQYLNGCVSTSSTLILLAGPALTTTFTIEHDTCGMSTGAIIPISTSGAPGPFTYSYDGGGTFGTGPLTTAVNGTYTVISMDPLTGCISNDYILVIDSIHDIVDESFTLEADFCEGNTVLPSGVITPGGLWTIISGAGTPGINATTGEITGGTIIPETYEVVYTIGVCNEKDTAFITYNANESAVLSVADYCAEDPNIVTIVGAIGGGFDFTIAPGDGASIDPFSGQVINAVPGSSYDITYTSPGVCPAVESIVVNVFNRDAGPTLIYGATSYCLGVSLEEISSAGGGVLNWYLNDPIPVIYSGTSYTPASLGIGNHMIYGATEDANGCRSEFDSVAFVILNSGVFDAGEDQEVCLGYSVELNAEGGGTYEWWSNPLLSDTTISNPSVQNLTAGQFFYVTITNDDGCVVMDSVYVDLRHVSDCDVIIYNAFSPNNDGVNDTWLIDGIESFPNNIVYIYNRWGDRIRKIEGYDNIIEVWDGTNKHDKIMPSGTYYFVVEVFGNDSESGWIQLIK